MRRGADRLSSLRWRLKATRRLWRTGAIVDMPVIPPEFFDAVARGQFDVPEPGDRIDPEVLKARGWALFPSSPTARVELWLDRHPLGRARLGIPRPDIDALSENPLAATAGFEIVADLSGWSPGEDGAELRAVATSVRGERYELPPLALTVDQAGAGGSAAAISPPAPRTPRAEGEGRRALVFTHQLNLGGAQLYLLDLLREVVRGRLVEPTVVSAMDGVLRRDLEALGIPVHISSMLPLEDLSSHIGRVEELTAWAGDRGFEAAFVNTATALSFPGAEVAAELGLPVVWAIHESFPPAVLWGDLSPQVRERAEASLAGASLVLFEAEATRRLFETRVGEGRGVVLPYGLDLEPIDASRAGFDPTAVRRDVGIAEDADVVLCVGTVEPRKAQLPLAQAFSLVAARHPRAHLVFVGGADNADSHALAGYIESSGLADRIELVPITADVQRWYGIADLLVCASDVESLPRTVLEAMARETPVLATAVFGLAELIDDGETGWLCEAGDVRVLAEGLDRALGSTPEERERIGRSARALVERRHALDAYGREVARLLAAVAEGRAPEVKGRAAAG
jgi:D-inositol-3-phosphate glycosyltransferase